MISILLKMIFQVTCVWLHKAISIKKKKNHTKPFEHILILLKERERLDVSQILLQVVQGHVAYSE